MIKRQLAVAIIIIVFLVSIALAASAGPLRAENPPPNPTTDPATRHLIGFIDKIDSGKSTITVKLKSGHERSVIISSSTQLLTYAPAKKQIALKDLKPTDRLAISSSNLSEGTINADLILLLPPPSSNLRIVKGSVKDLTPTTLTVFEPSNKSQKISLASFTVYSKKDHNIPSITNSQELKNDNQVLVVGDLKGDTIIATLVHIIS